jgi:hypothetical protein
MMLFVNLTCTLTMKIIKFISLALLLIIMVSCEKKEDSADKNYVFIKPFSATVTVGGIVGIKTLSFNVGDTVLGNEITEGMVTIRIAHHTYLNDGPPTSASYQELLNIPLEYLMLQGK